jgi:nucleotide-binding universal stress UspA family protein
MLTLDTRPRARIIDRTEPNAIIAPVGLNDRAADVAVGVAGQLAAALGAEVILAGISPIVYEPVDDLTPSIRLMTMSELQAATDRWTMERAAEAGQLLPATVARRTVLCWGPPGPAIVRAAERESAGMVIVPMRRAGAFGHLLHDGPDRYVLHHCDVPVLVVPVDSHGLAGGEHDGTADAAA